MLVFMSLLLSLSKCIYAQTWQYRCINYLLAPVPVFFMLTMSKYVLLKHRFLYDKSLVLQLIFNFTTLICVSAPSFCHSRENFVPDSCLTLIWVGFLGVGFEVVVGGGG